MFSSPSYCCVTRERFTADLKLLIALVQARQLPFLAAAIAYYAFLSVVPLLIIGLTVATMLAGPTLASDLLATLDEFLTPEAVSLLEDALIESPGRGSITFFGLAVLIWGALRIFRGLDIAFSQVYGQTSPKPIGEQFRDAIFVLLGITTAIASTVMMSALLSSVPLPLAGFLSGSVGLLFVLTVVFFPLYYVFPSIPITAREALPGAVFAAVGWTALGALFSIYTANAGALELYGVLGGVLLLLIWFYFGGLILLFGAALNVVIGERIRDRQLQQGALRQHSQQASMSERDGPHDEEPADQGASDTNSGESTEDAASRRQSRENTDTDNPDGDARSDGGTTGPRGNDDTDEPDGEENEKVEEDDGEAVEEDDSENADDSEEDDDEGPTGLRDPDVSARVSQEDIDELRRELDRMEDRLENRTVDRDAFESELKRDMKKYVRSRTRRGKATGWGPYLVLLYGTAMTLGAFYLLSSGWAVLAMFVIWLSTLGLYTLMVLVGMTVKGVSLPGRIINTIREFR